jgi:hypothetical protein
MEWKDYTELGCVCLALFVGTERVRLKTYLELAKSDPRKAARLERYIEATCRFEQLFKLVIVVCAVALVWAR